MDWINATPGAQDVVITSLEVPAEVRNSSQETLLDCDYQLLPSMNFSNAGLVVKWYLNEILVYQWIPGYPPRDLGLLKGQLDLRYKASEDQYTMYRALYITTLTTQMSGYYKCLVSTFNNEDFMFKKMVVYAPERNLILTLRKVDDETLDASCNAIQIYPEPRIFLYILTGNKTKGLDGVQVETVAKTGEYDIKAKALLTVETLMTPTEVVCKMTIPGTTYTSHRSVIYYPDREDRSSFPRPFVMTVSLISVLLMF